MVPHSPDDRDELLELVSNGYVQAILAATSEEPMPAKKLSEDTDADLSTIYRRVDQMLEHDLLVEKTRIVADGSHHSVYEANVDHLAIDIEEGELTVTLRLRDSAAARFARIWHDIRET